MLHRELRDSPRQFWIQSAPREETYRRHALFTRCKSGRQLEKFLESVQSTIGATDIFEDTD